MAKQFIDRIDTHPAFLQTAVAKVEQCLSHSPMLNGRVSFKYSNCISIFSLCLLQFPKDNFQSMGTHGFVYPIRAN